MKLSFAIAALSLVTVSAHAGAPVAVDVQLNNPAFAGVVKSYFESKRAQFRMVKAASGENSIKITVTEDLSHSASCQVVLEANVNGMTATATRNQESGFMFAKNRAAYCQAAVSKMLESELEWVQL